MTEVSKLEELTKAVESVVNDKQSAENTSEGNKSHTEYSQKVTESNENSNFVQPDESSEPEYSESERQAMEQGWKPKGNFTGDNFVSAEEYLRVGSLFKRIDSQNRQIKEMKQVIDKVSDHMSRSERSAYEKAYTDLLAQRREAVEIGNVEKFNHLDQQVKAIEPRIQQVTAPQPIQPAQEALDFAERNKEWFNNNNSEETREMTQAAMFISSQIAGKNLPPSEEIRIIEQKMAQFYPSKFKNQNRSAPSAVATSTASRGVAKGSHVSKLSPIQLRIGQDICKYTKGYTIEKYAEELHKQGQI